MEEVRNINWSLISLQWLCVFVSHNIMKGHGANTTTGNTAASEEHKALDQALLLVQILKSEYARVLKENDALQGRNILRKPEDLSTCATTTEEPFSLVTEKKNETTKNIKLHHIRKNNWRRFDYDNVFGPQPGINSSTLSTSAILNNISKPYTITREQSNSVQFDQTTSPSAVLLKGTITNALIDQTVTSTTQTNISDEIIYKTTTTEKTFRTKAFRLSRSSTGDRIESTDATMINAPPQSLKKKLLLSSSKVSSTREITTAREIEMIQAAAELAKELGVSTASFKVVPRLSVFGRMTTKIFLADSTRYPIPFPENHAFCFTNPNNALCRTII